jgi:hypothetical protein
LILDDDFNYLKCIAEQVVKIKKELNYNVKLDYYTNPIEGLSHMYYHLKNKNIYYDLVITDENMPFMNGSIFVNFYKTYLESNGFYKVPFISLGQDQEHFSNSMFDGFIKKPCTKEGLINLFNAYLKL